MIETVFDKITLIAIALGVFTQIATILIYIKSKSARKYAAGFISLVIFAQFVLIYGSYIEPKWIEVNKQTVKINDNGENTLKVVIVADYHLGPYKGREFVEKSVNLINEQSPDIVLMPGDFIYSYAEQADDLKPIENIKSKYGVYATLGNHDYGITRSNKDDSNELGALRKSDYVVEKLKEFKVTVLRDEKVVINKREENEITLVGLEDIWGSTDLYSDELFDFEEDDTVILLEHNPDIILDERVDIFDLIISGHTHGGQIRLPIFGSVPPLPTKLGKGFDMGLFELDSGNQLFITKGIGEMGPRARLLTRPEIAVLDIKY